MAAKLSEGIVKLDSEHRVTVRKPVAEHYRMEQYDDGRVVLFPMELVSKSALEEMGKAVELVKQGVVGKPVEMDQLMPFLEESSG